MSITLLLIITLMFVATLGGGKQVWNAISSPRSRVRKDLETMKQDLLPWAGKLVPINQEELELLSLHAAKLDGKKNTKVSASGVFTSIYHEPMVAWMFKKYNYPQLKGLLYARTGNREYAYQILQDGIEVAIDGQYIGVLRPDGKLMDKDGKNLLALIESKNQAKQLPVWINKREVGSVAVENVNALPMPRAVDWLKDMEPAERDLFVGLSLIQMAKPFIK